MHTILSIFAYVVDTIFPKSCEWCGKAGVFLCEECLLRAPRAELMNNSSSKPDSFITAIFNYQNTEIRGVIWKFKYKNARGIAKHFGGVLYDEIIGEVSDDIRLSTSDVFLLVPIPLHK